MIPALFAQVADTSTVTFDVNALVQSIMTGLLALATAWIGYQTIKIRVSAEARAASTNAQLTEIHRVTNTSYTDAKNEIKALRETVAAVLAQQPGAVMPPTSTPEPAPTPEVAVPGQEIVLEAPVSLTVTAPSEVPPK